MDTTTATASPTGPEPAALIPDGASLYDTDMGEHTIYRMLDGTLWSASWSDGFDQACPAALHVATERERADLTADWPHEPQSGQVFTNGEAVWLAYDGAVYAGTFDWNGNRDAADVFDAAALTAARGTDY